jgi:hypothetical protein
MLRKASPPPLLHDVTIAYVDLQPGQRSSEKSILFGRFPKEVHMFVKRSPLPAETDPLLLVKWLNDCFDAKEELLTNFYENNYRPSPLSHDDPWRLEYTEKYLRSRTSLARVSLWIVCLVLFFRQFEWFRWVCITLIMVYVAVTGFSGFDLIELMLHGQMVLSEGSIKR